MAAATKSCHLIVATLFISAFQSMKTSLTPIAWPLLIAFCSPALALSESEKNGSQQPIQQSDTLGPEAALQAMLKRAELEGKTEAENQAKRQLETSEEQPFSKQKPPSPGKESGLRKIFVGASSSDPILAAYLDRWAQQVEKGAKAYYPEAVKQQKLHGSVQVTLEIDTKGNLKHLEINRSSEQKALDKAIQDILQKISPFEPLPADIRKKADILSITRTVRFTTAESMAAERQPPPTLQLPKLQLSE